MNYYQFHLSDWALHTSHLTLEEEAVYRRLLDYYYDTEKPIPEKTQLVIRRLRLTGYEEIVGIILSEFFVLEDGNWHNLRADFEISEYQKKADRARRNGKKGGRPRIDKGQKTQSVISGNLKETGSKANQEPLTKNQEPVTNNNTLVGKAIPTPHDEIRAIWSEVMPELTQPRAWNATRQRDLKARWSEDKNRQNLDWWRGFFEYIRESDFLMGRSESNRNWQIDLPWLLKSSNFCKVADGNYENK